MTQSKTSHGTQGVKHRKKTILFSGPKFCPLNSDRITLLHLRTESHLTILHLLIVLYFDSIIINTFLANHSSIYID